MDNYFPADKAQQLSLFQSQFESNGISTNGASHGTPASSNGAPAPTLASVAHATNGNKTKAEVMAQSVDGSIQGAEMCPSCHTVSLVRAEGCKTCLRCGYSEC